MTSSSSISAASAADHGGGTLITAIHPALIQSHILNRLDGPTLAATSCASAGLLSLCKDDDLWRDICHSTWPSTADPRVRAAVSALPSAHRSLYSDAFPAAAINPGKTLHHQPRVSNTSELISAVDIYCHGALIYSKVLAMETLSDWFLNTPFRVDLLDPKETVATPLKFDGGASGTSPARAAWSLTLSWILIDPVRRRAVNVSSREVVEARWHWLTEDLQLWYSTVVAADGGGELVQCTVVVSCGVNDGGEVRLREVSMRVEDMEGKILSGMESLGIIEDAMDGPRSKNDWRREKDAYEMFLRMRERRRERKQMREKCLDMVFIAAGISIFFGIGIFFLSR